MNQYKAIFLSNWLGNPYKKLLALGLENQNIVVEEHLWRTWFVPLCLRDRSTKILHLHTLHPFLNGKNWLTRGIKLIMFVGQIILLRFWGIKTVWTVHEWKDKIAGGKANISAVRAAILGVFFHAIITHCSSTQRAISIFFGLQNTAKVVVIPHGNYIDCYENIIDSATAREKLGISPYSFVFVLFGNIYRYKGIIEAIDAFVQLNNAETTLLIAGKTDSQELKQEITAKIQQQPNILWVDRKIPDLEIQTYLNASDCLLIPYQVFTTSGIAVLGMSFAKACIAPRAGFFDDILDSGGTFFYHPEQPNSLLTAMNQALERRNLIEDMGRHNLELAKNWHWQSVGQQTALVYDINR